MPHCGAKESTRKRVKWFAPHCVVAVAAREARTYAGGRMKLQVKQAGGSQELTIGSQKEFLQLYNRGIIAGDDLVLRGDRWVPASELTWICGTALENRR